MSISHGLLWFCLAGACFLGILLVMVTGDRLDELEEEEEHADGASDSSFDKTVVPPITTGERAQ